LIDEGSGAVDAALDPPDQALGVRLEIAGAALDVATRGSHLTLRAPAVPAHGCGTALHITTGGTNVTLRLAPVAAQRGLAAALEPVELPPQAAWATEHVGERVSRRHRGTHGDQQCTLRLVA
jgi:hypothetical protein